MKTSMSLAALALGLALADAAPGQTRTQVAFAGNSDIGVLNIARATAITGNTPQVEEELSSEGWFLGSYLPFYTSQAEGFTTSSGIGLGAYHLRVGSNDVRSGYVSSLVLNLNRSATVTDRDVPAANRSKSYNVSGFPVIVSGSVSVDSSVSLTYAFRGSVSMSGSLKGDATGHASARLATPIPTWGAMAGSHTLMFGSQTFSGTALVFPGGDASSLRYEMGAMNLSLNAYVTLAIWNAMIPIFSRNIVQAARGAITIANFL